jgi:hypothetical protein
MSTAPSSSTATHRPGHSPYVAQLLGAIRSRNAADREAVYTLAMHGLQFGPEHRREDDAERGTRFIFRREDVPSYLRACGIESWHRATWLRLEDGGSVVADVPLRSVLVGPAGARLRSLAESALLEACICGCTQAAMEDDGMATFAFSADELASFLLISRFIIRRSPEWQLLG